MRLHDLKPNPGAKHRRKRLGAGESSGHGKTSGKGHKGQKARSGGSIRPGFEGGQMPLHRRLPKRGFNNAAFKTVYGIVNLDDLEKRFEEGAAINEKLLRGAGLVRGSLDGIKILGRGEVRKKFHLEVDSISVSAREKIEKAGGTVTVGQGKAHSGAQK
jgi:large subunit ribosomal protein L15